MYKGWSHLLLMHLCCFLSNIIVSLSFGINGFLFFFFSSVFLVFLLPSSPSLSFSIASCVFYKSKHVCRQEIPSFIFHHANHLFVACVALALAFCLIFPKFHHGFSLSRIRFSFFIFFRLSQRQNEFIEVMCERSLRPDNK